MVDEYSDEGRIKTEEFPMHPWPEDKEITSEDMKRVFKIKPIAPERIETNPYPLDVIGSLDGYSMKFLFKKVRVLPEGESSEIALYRSEGVFKTPCGQSLKSKLFYKDGKFLDGGNIIMRTE